MLRMARRSEMESKSVKKIDSLSGYFFHFCFRILFFIFQINLSILPNHPFRSKSKQEITSGSFVALSRTSIFTETPCSRKPTKSLYDAFAAPPCVSELFRKSIFIFFQLALFWVDEIHLYPASL